MSNSESSTSFVSQSPLNSSPGPSISVQLHSAASVQANVQTLKRKAPDLGSLLGKKPKKKKGAQGAEIEQYLEDTFGTFFDYYNDYY